MRDPARIARIAELLVQVWNKVPDWRLTQLVINTCEPSESCAPVFNMEDDEFELRLQKLVLSLDKQLVHEPSKDEIELRVEKLVLSLDKKPIH